VHNQLWQKTPVEETEESKSHAKKFAHPESLTRPIRRPEVDALTISPQSARMNGAIGTQRVVSPKSGPVAQPGARFQGMKVPATAYLPLLT
jgi:hypothetical protein